MSMRLYSRADFEKRLLKLNLESTNILAGNQRLWVDPSNSERCVYVPDNIDMFPDYIEDMVIQHLQTADCRGEKLTGITYNIAEKKEAEIVNLKDHKKD